jgi:(E)-4-hydroxy-3-methyl-but-2-enyl pyrophosphate reductase
MTVRVAKHAGFCFGVKNAIDLVLKSIPENKALFTYGHIIHNPHVIRELEEKGVRTVLDIDALPEASEGAAVVIRSHGAPPEVYGALKSKGYKIIDATCPYVKRVHKKAKEAADAGVPVIIIGEKEHPEVIGTKGWAGENSHVVYVEEDVAALPELKSALVVGQTTIAKQKWDDILGLLQQRIPELEGFMSICSTTEERQEEAEALAKASDHVIVIGGRNSSNTRKLFEACSRHCKDTRHIEDIKELSIEIIDKNDIITIVAGASTPDWLIREVYLRMSEDEKTLAENSVAGEENGGGGPTTVEQANADFMKEIDKSFVKLHRGQLLNGTVVQVTDDEVYVNVGYKTDGILSKAEFSIDGTANPKDSLNIGDEIEVEVLTLNDGQGNVLLSKKRIEAKNRWNDFVNELEEDKEYTCRINKVVKGGLLTKIEGYDAFIPASQVGLRYVEDLSGFEGKEMVVGIIDVDKRQKRIVASQKKVLQKEARQKQDELWGSFKKGDIVRGTVKRLADFGAFVDIGGIDGLLHIRDISWNNIKHPSDVLHEGDEFDVLILNTDPEKRRISLGLKQLLPKPWDLAPEKYIVGDTVEGKVVRIVPFGAFVELEPGIDGLIHVSQIATRRLERVEDELRLGDMVKAKVMEVIPAKKKISLSRRELLMDEQRTAAPKDEPKNKEEEVETYELPPVQETTVSLADFFPKSDE